MDNVVPMLQGFLVTYGLNILGAILILIFGRWLASLAANLLKRGLTRSNVDKSLVGFAGNIAYFGLLTFTVLAALSRLGVETTSFVAVVGAAGLAIGLALEGALANFAAGVLILVFKPIKVGDYVEVAGTAGTVEEIQIFTTMLASPDQKTIIVPNGQVTSNNIINYTARGTRRLDMVFGIGYDDDLLKAKNLLEKIITEEGRVLPEPPPTIAVLELGDSSVNFAVRPYVTVANYWPVLFDVTEKVKLTFDKEGISIPFPQRDVHLYQEK